MSTTGLFNLTVRDAQGEIKSCESFPNAVTDQGVDHLLNVGFKGAAASATWYIGLISSLNFAGITDSDTQYRRYWIEATTYDEATRQVFNAGTVTNKSLDNSASPAVFTASEFFQIRGLYLVNVSTKGAKTGVLYSVAQLPNIATLSASDTLTVTYDIAGRL